MSTTYQDLLRPILQQMANEGLSRKEAAKLLGVRYQVFSSLVAGIGVEWLKLGGRPADLNRRAAILALYDAGETLEAIGDRFGVTRERVRQIVKKSGRKPRRRQAEECRERLAKRLVEMHGASAAEAANALGVSVESVRYLAKQEVVKFIHRNSDVEATLAALAERIKAGESIRHAAITGGVSSSTLQYYCRQHGISSPVPTRWTVSERRPEIIRSGREAGKTWAEIAADIASVEGTRGCVPGSIVNWAAKYCPDTLQIKPPRKPKERKPRSPKVCYAGYAHERYPASVDIDVRDTVRETALANRGKASASQIASAIGVSRNSIIGHWFRARSAGEAA